eukprot:scaffold320874_cov17-Tisochrysis_lutea.AAC.2
MQKHTPAQTCRGLKVMYLACPFAQLKYPRAACGMQVETGYTILHHQKKLCLPYERRSSKNISALASLHIVMSASSMSASPAACRQAIFIQRLHLLYTHGHATFHRLLHTNARTSAGRPCVGTWQ